MNHREENPMAMDLDAPRFGGDLALGTARGLGWFSVGLGLAECLMPRAVARAVGMAGRESGVRAAGPSGRRTTQRHSAASCGRR